MFEWVLPPLVISPVRAHAEALTLQTLAGFHPNSAELMTRNIRSISDGYFKQAIPVINEQLAKAGYRLAALLNQTFSGS